MNVEVAGKLVQLRKNKGLSQEDLAEKIGVSRQAVSKWERAESSPDLDNMVLLAKLYSISLDELLLKDEGEIFEESAPAAEDTEEIACENESPGRESPAEKSGFFAESFSEDSSDISAGFYETPKCKEKNYRDATNVRMAKKMLDPSYPVVVLAAFLIVGYVLNMWHPGWLLFVTIPLYYTMMPGIVKIVEIRRGERAESLMKAVKDMLDPSYPLLTVLFFLLTGVMFGMWHPGWMIFITIPLYYAIMPFIVGNYK